MTALLIPTATQLTSTLLTAGLVLIAAACCGAIWLVVDWAIDYRAARVFFKDDAAPKTDEQRREELDALIQMWHAPSLSEPAAKGFTRRVAR